MKHKNEKDSLLLNEDWRLWCRLCAKVKMQNCINVFLKNEQACSSIKNTVWQNNSGVNILATEIGRFFWVNMSPDDDLPQCICSECNNFIESLVAFSEKVAKVQKMFCILQSSFDVTKLDIDEVRHKCGVANVEHENEHAVRFSQTLSVAAEVYFVEEKPEIPHNGSTDRLHDADEMEDEENPLASKSGTQIKDEEVTEAKCVESDGCFDDVEENTMEYAQKVSKENNNDDDDDPKTIDPFQLEDNDAFNDAALSTSDGLPIKKTKRVRITRKEKVKKKPISEKKLKKNVIFECTICKSKFRDSNHFESHMKRVHNQDMEIDEDKKKFTCLFCEKKFKNKWTLESHINIHKNDRPFICEECGVSVRTHGTLKSHMLTHTDYAPFECDVCKKSFKTEYRLRVHKEIHDPNKHVCAECGLQLNSRITLNRHRLIHSDKMEHKCDYCGRQFKRAKALKNHLILHTGLKPYACDFCDRTFANGSNCRTHKKKSHPVELAAQEASGGTKSFTQNIPNLTALKAITKNNDNLAPVVSKQSGHFAFGKKPKPITKTEANLSEEHISQKSSVSGNIQSTSESCIPAIDNIYYVLNKTQEFLQNSQNQQQLLIATNATQHQVSNDVP